MLGRIDQERLHGGGRATRASSPTCSASSSDLQDYLEQARLVGARPTAATAQPLVAYFSAEFGLTECLPIYSGGLGVLAGDHLKSASDLGLPLVGVGLLYQQGYFRQYLNADGWQQERYPEQRLLQHAASQPVRDADGKPLTRRASTCPAARCTAQVWRVAGRARAALPARHQRAGEPARGPRHHRPALRRRPGDAHPPGDRAGHRRRAGAARRWASTRRSAT